jgi:hypothetical protein
MKTQHGLNVHKDSLLYGDRGVLLLFASLLILSSLLAVITCLYLGMSGWLTVPIFLWMVFLLYLFRFKEGSFGFWKLVFAFMVYFLTLFAFIFVVLPKTQTAVLPAAVKTTR